MSREILDELAKYGVINIRRAYGNWKSPGLKSWEAVLHEYAIQPVQQFAYTKGKNATDMGLVIDALDLLYSDSPDAFGIVSSDSDFTPLVMHLRAKGAQVFGFGAQKTPMPFVNACSRFLFLEHLGGSVEVAADEGEKPARGKPSSGRKPRNGKKADAAAPTAVDIVLDAAPAKFDTAALKQDARLVTLLRNAVESMVVRAKGNILTRADLPPEVWAPAPGDHDSWQFLAGRPWSEVERALRAELGPRADVLLARFDREPIAVASIGQVHRARLPDGRELAVKVRHPGIEAAFAADFRAAGVGKLVGIRYLATLFGLTLLTHQIGGFLGAYLGGRVFEATGAYDIVWFIDIALAIAALSRLPWPAKPALNACMLNNPAADGSAPAATKFCCCLNSAAN